LIDQVYADYGKGPKAVHALNGASLQVEQGEIFGLLGPNGAGKTTLLSCLEGLHRPLSGQVWVHGLDVTRQPQQVKRLLGIQLQRSALLEQLTAAELIQVYTALYEVFLDKQQIASLLDQFELGEAANRPARRLSGGQQQRLALALAVANDPQVVLLDEPTSALDPHARRGVWQLIRRMHDQGRTILITTHAMEEAEALCGRVAIIDVGKVIACDTPVALTRNLDASPVLKTSLEAPLAKLESLPGVRAVRYSGQYTEIESSQPQETLSALQSLALHLGRPLGEVTLRQPNLEDVFLQMTGRSL
jgi:ABC-2 type transport system ATP-binding protein